MKGLQWSVNGAIGATYKLHKGVGLFFEPQIGYFFDNDQPESIRTTGSASFGLGVGLRFNF
jgi:predicted porin